MNPRSLTTTERETIATWADKQLAQKIAKGDLINNPAGWIAWRTKELESEALQNAATRNQLARYADAWGIGRTTTSAYRPPVDDIPHPKAEQTDVERWRNLQRVLFRLPADHWLRVHAQQRLMEPRRPDGLEEEITEQDETRANTDALIVLAELEALIEQNADEVKQTLGAAKPILKAMP